MLTLALSGIDVSIKGFLDADMDLLFKTESKSAKNVNEEVLKELISVYFDLENLWPRSSNIRRSREVFGHWVNSSSNIMVKIYFLGSGD